MFIPLRVTQHALASHVRAACAHIAPAAVLVALHGSAIAAPNDYYKPVAAKPCACDGVTTASGYGTPYAPPPKMADNRYRPLDGSPRYATGPNAPASRGGYGAGAYQAPYDLPAVWTGAYLGINAGYGWGKTSVALPGYGATSPSGGLGGLHGGYNWQSGNFVFGAEADLDLSWMESTSTFSSGNTLTSHPGWVSSARGRAGYAFNNFLIFGTVGLALTNTNFTLQQPGASNQMIETQFGYVIGAGVEMKVAPQISVRLEALHYGFADKNVSYNGSTTPLSTDLNTVRAGLTFHLN
jgi:outer membrane immunogenic protein